MEDASEGPNLDRDKLSVSKGLVNPSWSRCRESPRCARCISRWTSTILLIRTNSKSGCPELRKDCRAMSSSQQISVLADELEKHVCDQLNKQRPAGVLRRMKVNQLVNNANKAGEVRRWLTFPPSE